jgi:hypothetical protein
MTIYIDGFERSGNTYLAVCIGTTLGIDVSPQFTHLLSIFEEKKKDSLFVVPVRDALPSIVSAKLYRDYQWQNNIPRQDNILGREHERTGNPEELIQRYIEYTQYLIDHDDFFIAPFKEFTKDHNRVIDVMIKDHPQYSAVQRFTKEEMIDICDKHYKKRNPYVNESSNSYLGNFPRTSSKEKQEVEKMFIDKYSKELNHIQLNINELYNRYYQITNSSTFKG